MEKLRLPSPLKNLAASAVDTMRYERMIPVKDLDPPTFTSWVNTTLPYMEELPSKITYLGVDNYTQYEKILPLFKGRKCCIGERNIVNLNQKLAKLYEWQGFLLNN